MLELPRLRAVCWHEALAVTYRCGAENLAGAPCIMRIAIIILACLALSACGMAKAARVGGQTFDKYGCLARDFKGHAPCDHSDAEPGKP